MMGTIESNCGVVLTLKGEQYCEENRQWSVNGVPLPEGVTPAEWRAKTRERIEYHLDMAKVLIDALDLIARDPDLEPDADDEPSLCGPVQYLNGKYEADLELDNADLEDNGDAEPDADAEPEDGI